MQRPTLRRTATIANLKPEKAKHDNQGRHDGRPQAPHEPAGDAGSGTRRRRRGRPRRRVTRSLLIKAVRAVPEIGSLAVHYDPGRLPEVRLLAIVDGPVVRLGGQQLAAPAAELKRGACLPPAAGRLLVRPRLHDRRARQWALPRHGRRAGIGLFHQARRAQLCSLPRLPSGPRRRFIC